MTTALRMSRGVQHSGIIVMPLNDTAAAAAVAVASTSRGYTAGKLQIAL